MDFFEFLQEDEIDEVLEFIVHLDTVPEDIYDSVNELIDKIDYMDLENLSEYERKWVIRGGKRIKKLFCPPHMMAKGRKCVIIPASRRAKMKRIAKRTARKRRSKRSTIRRKMRKARRRRKSMGL